MLSILKRIPFAQRFIQQKLKKQSQFYDQNHRFVLSSYRYLLKTIPTLYVRKLQQKQKLNQLQYIFHHQMILESIEQIRFKSNKLKEIVQAIRSGDTTHIGQFQMSLYGQVDELKYQFANFQKIYKFQKKKTI